MFPMINKIQTGKRIAFWMRIHALTPRDVQRYLSLSCVQTVYRWLDGSNIPSIDNLYALSWLFQVKISAILVGNALELYSASPLLKQTYAYWVLYEAKRQAFHKAECSG